MTDWEATYLITGFAVGFLCGFQFLHIYLIKELDRKHREWERQKTEE